MRESIGMTVTINIMIVFILIAFAFIAGTVSYSRAYKAGSRVVGALEKYEGYNKLSKLQIEKDLMTIGYSTGDSLSCVATKTSSGSTGELASVSNSPEHFHYCIYQFDNDGDAKHYSYGVTVYMTIDISMFGITIDLPVYVKSRRIYKF